MEAVWPRGVVPERDSRTTPPAEGTADHARDARDVGAAAIGKRAGQSVPGAGAGAVGQADPTALHVAELFAEIYRSHFEYVWQSAHRLGVRTEEVDDVVQETFLNVHRLLATYDNQGSPRGWLFSILYRVSQRHKRSSRRWLFGWDAEASIDTVAESSAHGPERRAEAEEEARKLEAILDKLNPEQRAVLILAELEERPLSEVAEILGINVNTARSRLRLAREHVEARLAQQNARDRWRLK